jgi:DNA-binding winged helix-turn-helix (wHTH) protein/TolB-like protein/Tfp pilus assembly protein PilF
MSNKTKHLREFGKFQLDAEKRVLWCKDEPVKLALKEIELLCVLTENGGEVLTKNELMEKVWADSFVEESNLSRHIYVLRKTFRDFGETEDLIQTVPSRGYRFVGEVHETETGELIIEKHSVSRTLIETVSDETKIEPQKREYVEQGKRQKLKDKAGRHFFAVLAAVILFVALLGGFAIWRFQNSPAKTSVAEIKSIAVLPLKSLIDEDGGKALGLGLTDALIVRLGGLQKINVPPLSAVRRYANSDKDALTAGRELKADAILDGTIQQSNGRLRVTIRLLNTDNGEQFWAGKFDESEADIFKLQDSIAAQIAESLALNFNHAIPPRSTENPEAYQAYLRGRFHFDKRAKADFKLSEEYFKLALEKDANYALAYAGLADIYALMASTKIDQAKRDELYRQAAQSAEKALTIDERLADAHTSLGSIKHTHGWDWKRAENYFRRALELNPNLINAHQWYALLLITLDRKEEAAGEINRAIELDALSSVVLRNAIAVYYQSRRYTEALAILQKALELDPNIKKEFLFTRAKIYLKQEKYQEAITEIESSYTPEQIKEHSRTMFPLAVAYLHTGQLEKAQEYVKEMEKRVEKGDATAYWLALVYADNGAKDKAVELLERSYEAHDDRLINLKTEPALDALRDNPRFEMILRKMNLQ